jgi:hypothetical protein
MTVTISGGAQVSFGQISFSASVSQDTSSPFSYENFDSDVSTSESDLVSYGGLEPSFVRLTFTAYEFQQDGPALDTYLYSATVGTDPAQDFMLETGSDFEPDGTPQVLTETFSVDPTAGSVLLTVQGTASHTGGNDVLNAAMTASDLDYSVEFLDAQGNVIPEPSSFSLCAIAMAILVLRLKDKRKPSKPEPGLNFR